MTFLREPDEQPFTSAGDVFTDGDFRAVSFARQDRPQQRSMRLNLALDVRVEEFRIENELSRPDLQTAQTIQKDLMAARRADRPVEVHIRFDQGEDVSGERAELQAVERLLDRRFFAGINPALGERQFDSEGFQHASQAVDFSRALRRQLGDVRSAVRPISTRPSSASTRSASRTVPREVSKRCDKGISGSVLPGGNSPLRIKPWIFLTTADLSVWCSNSDKSSSSGRSPMRTRGSE